MCCLSMIKEDVHAGFYMGEGEGRGVEWADSLSKSALCFFSQPLMAKLRQNLAKIKPSYFSTGSYIENP